MGAVLGDKVVAAGADGDGGGLVETEEDAVHVDKGALDGARVAHDEGVGVHVDVVKGVDRDFDRFKAARGVDDIGRHAVALGTDVGGAVAGGHGALGVAGAGGGAVGVERGEEDGAGEGRGDVDGAAADVLVGVHGGELDKVEPGGVGADGVRVDGHEGDDVLGEGKVDVVVEDGLDVVEDGDALVDGDEVVGGFEAGVVVVA